MRQSVQPTVLARPATRLFDILAGAALDGPPPIWLMRQAGRYLPEYRELRARAGGFLDLCYTPALAAEVTLQPIRRFGFDAAILFSDILVVPDALGQGVRFVEGEGPRLDAIGSASRHEPARRTFHGARSSRASTKRLRASARSFPPTTALIGFCGAPWTVATYMVGGRGSSDQAAARQLAYRDPTTFGRLIDIVTNVFDRLPRRPSACRCRPTCKSSTVGPAIFPTDEFATWVVAPTARIVAELKRRHPGMPIIGFPRGAGANAPLLRARDEGRRAGMRHGDAASADARAGRRHGRGGAGQSRSASARRRRSPISTREYVKLSMRCGVHRSSSIWATASSHTRRPNMSPASSKSCAGASDLVSRQDSASARAARRWRWPRHAT